MALRPELLQPSSFLTTVDKYTQTESGADILGRLAATIETRKSQAASESYVASLFAAGEDAILQKVGEEAMELVLAAKSGERQHITAEAADLVFHMLVLMSRYDLGPDDILTELERREGLSGHTEKAARGTR